MTKHDVHHALYVLEMTKANLQYVVQNGIPAESGEDDPLFPISTSEIEILGEAHDALVRIGLFLKAGRRWFNDGDEQKR